MYNATITKQWIENDKMSGNHVYIGYKDIDGFDLAEGMVLKAAWLGDEDRIYYVKKDVKKNKYYLQSFWENITHFAEYYKGDYDELKSRGAGIESATLDFEIMTDKNSIPMFIENFGYKKGEFPPRNSVVEGKWHLEDVKE